MSHVPHELSEEFPDAGPALHSLRQSNPHAARLMDEYHEINRTLHRVETDLEPVSDDEATRMRKTRMTLKDEIARLLRDVPAP
jgi:uncharacterized protein YdcH (DUF465 family)